MMKDKLWKVNIPLESSKKNKGFAIIGNIELLTDELNVIYDWKFTASKINIDRMVNPLWKEKKNKAFIYREELFRYARIDAQFDRPRNWRAGQEQVSQPIVLTGTTFERVVEWFNDPEHFAKTDIMLLADILNGEQGNTTQAAKADELIYTRYYGAQIPFGVLLKDHIGVSQASEEAITKLINNCTIVKELTFLEWCDMNPDTIGRWSKMLQEADLGTQITKIESVIRKEAQSHFKHASKVHAECDAAVKKFEKEMEKIHGKENPIFDVKTLVKNKWNEIAEVQESFELVHIYPVWKIKQDIMLATSAADKKKLISLITDKDNIIPLNYYGAELFETGDIYYDQTGHMRMKVVNLSIAKQLYGYHQIAKNKLTKKMVANFEKHRDLHGSDPFKYLEKKLDGRAPKK